MDKNINYTVQTASADDCGGILSLCRSLIGTDGCAWDEYYPARENIECDTAAGKQFIIRIDGKIAACASAAFEEEHNAIGCWDKRMKNPVGLYRVGVASEFQHRGLARALVNHIIEAAPSMGADGVILLAAKSNPRAVKLYESAGFEICGECRMYDTDWHCMQFICRRNTV
ncbi:MAG: GNAT family N-acetyltransferase [Eubacteriales bacterium]